jgi:hypothetical protein
MHTSMCCQKFAIAQQVIMRQGIVAVLKFKADPQLGVQTNTSLIRGATGIIARPISARFRLRQPPGIADLEVSEGALEHGAPQSRVGTAIAV